MLLFLLFASLVACSLGAARLRRPRLDGRIVGGRPVDIADFPYQVLYEYGNIYVCGGSIISPDWVVTAGHCAYGSAVSISRFRAGSSIRGSGGTLHPAAQIILNPRYDPYIINFDIAVVRVSVPFTYGPAVQPISLTNTEPPVGALAVVSGWGTLNYGDTTLPSQLQAVELNIVDRYYCGVYYNGYGGITSNEICAGVSGGGKGACSGDDGGPLVVGGVQVGIVSWGVGCADAQYPGVYSNVAILRSWVTQETGVQ